MSWLEGIKPFEITTMINPDIFYYSYNPPMLKYNQFGSICTKLKEYEYMVSEEES